VVNLLVKANALTASARAHLTGVVLIAVFDAVLMTAAITVIAPVSLVTILAIATNYG